MTDDQARALIGIVKHRLLPLIQGHPEADDMLGEAILKAYQVVERLRDSPWPWTVLAAKAAQWQAWDYLRSHRSGQLNAYHSHEQSYPIPWSSLSAPDLLGATDGGIEAADARLQLWLTPIAVPPAWDGLCRNCKGSVPCHADGSPRLFYCSPKCYRRYHQDKRRERKRLEAMREGC